MFGLISLEENRKRHKAGQTKSKTGVGNPFLTESRGTQEETLPVQGELPIAYVTPKACPQGSIFAQMTKTFLAIVQTLKSDFQIIFERDPAARNGLEVLCCYPGLHALVLHRIAHWLHHQKIAFFPRFISHIGRFLTGIEIHPGATIGRGVFIDHGMGVVIGETAIIGDYCLIYQNVTLGGTGKETGKRHPTLGSHVVVGTGAKVLGNIEIGSHVRIGAGSIVLRNVPSDCTVVGVPGRIISRRELDCPLEHGKLPDVEASVIRSLLDRIEQLEQQLQNFVSEEIKLNLVKEKQQEINSPDAVESLFSHSVAAECGDGQAEGLWGGAYKACRATAGTAPCEAAPSPCTPRLPFNGREPVTPEQEFLVCELPKEFFRDNSLLQEAQTLTGFGNPFPAAHSRFRSQQPS